MKVSASILSCDFSNMEKEISKIENSDLDFLHIDVMDGHFVPNISFGPHVVDCVKKISHIPFETHLMTEYPLDFVEKFKSSDIIIFHLESQNDPMDVIYAIKNMGKKVGISLKPRTDALKIFPYLGQIDLVLIMTVEPGFGGQLFMKNQVKKIKVLKEIIDNKNFKIDLEVDGGINETNAKICQKNGANIAVAGSYIFKSDNPEKSISLLKSI